jgi:hypothetical protein
VSKSCQVISSSAVSWEQLREFRNLNQIAYLQKGFLDTFGWQVQKSCLLYFTPPLLPSPNFDMQKNEQIVPGHDVALANQQF